MQAIQAPLEEYIACYSPRNPIVCWYLDDIGSTSQCKSAPELGCMARLFSRLSPQGELKQDIPTLVTLEGMNDNQTVRQTIQHFFRNWGSGTRKGAGV